MKMLSHGAHTGCGGSGVAAPQAWPVFVILTGVPGRGGGEGGAHWLMAATHALTVASSSNPVPAVSAACRSAMAPCRLAGVTFSRFFAISLFCLARPQRRHDLQEILAARRRRCIGCRRRGNTGVLGVARAAAAAMACCGWLCSTCRCPEFELEVREVRSG